MKLFGSLLEDKFDVSLPAGESLMLNASRKSAGRDDAAMSHQLLNQAGAFLKRRTASCYRVFGV